MHDTGGSTVLNLDSDTSLYNFTSSTECDSAKVLPASEKSGWFMNLNQYGQGEQTVSSALIAGGSAIFNTNRTTPADNDVGTNSLGKARGYFVDLLNASGGVGSKQISGGDRDDRKRGGKVKGGSDGVYIGDRRRKK